MKDKFDIGLFVREGWATFTNNISSLVIATLIYLLVQMFVSFLPFIGSLISLAISGPLLGGLYLVALDAANGRDSDAKRIFDGFDQFKSYFLAYLLSSLFIVLSIMIVLIPLGIIAAVTTSFGLMEINPEDPPVALLLLMPLTIIPLLIVSSWYLFIYIDIGSAGVPFWDALERSRKTAMAVQGKIILFMFVLFLILLGGMFLFGIGILLAIPLCLCIQVSAYKHLYDGGASRAPNNVPIDAANPLLTTPPPLLPDEENATGPIVFREQSSCAICFVLVEGHEPDRETMEKIVQIATPEALSQNPPAKLVPVEVNPWPEREDLSNYIKDTLRDYTLAHPSEPDYSDLQTHTSHVWKGRDKSSRKNMAVVSLHGAG